MYKRKSKFTITEKVMREQGTDVPNSNSLGTVIAQRSCKVETVRQSERVHSTSCSHSSIHCRGCPACKFERNGCINEDQPFDIDLVKQLSARKGKERKKAAEQPAAEETSIPRTPKCRGKAHRRAPTHTRTFFINVICKYQLPKRGVVSRPSDPIQHSSRSKDKGVFNETHCTEILNDFIDKMPKTSTEERHQFLIKRWSEQIEKDQATQLMTKGEREFVFVRIAMDCFWSDVDKQFRCLRKFRLRNLENAHDLLKYTPETHWLDILQSKVMATDDVSFSQFHENLKTLIGLWRSSSSRFLMKDINHPGLIESCVERKMNFNHVTLGMLLSIFGVIPQFIGPFQPVTLLEMYSDRMNYEARRLRKHEQQFNLQDGVEEYFQRKCRTNVNLAIKAYLRAQKLIHKEQHSKQHHMCDSKVKNGHKRREQCQ